ncbi:unnamed protein product [Meganyctiphanes norvegica]|uniref:C-type lectin domain-containing protein n=1 Tax=Meganyctiphanes norvegica TaxID=48144 RepID=A0AAV2Q0D3_MEGNR
MGGSMFILVCVLVGVAAGANTGVDERKAQALAKIPVKIQELMDVVEVTCAANDDTVTGLAQIVNTTQADTSKYIKDVVEALENSVTQAVAGLGEAIKQNSDETTIQMKMLTDAVLSAQEGIKQMANAIAGLTHKLNNGGSSSNHIEGKGKYVVSCKKPFRNYNGQCLYISNAELNWGAARKKCQQIGGDLAEHEDLEALINFVKLEGLVSTSYWIGASDHKAPRNFIWISGARVTTGWRKDQTEPDYANPGRDCVYIRDRGIGDLVCTHAFGFLCATT